MVTRLNQRRIKSTDPAFQSLKEQMEARLRADGTGYIMPVGGIPRGDMNEDVQDALDLADQAYIVPAAGIPKSILEFSIRETLDKADISYSKPATGIPITDLEQSIQDRLTDFSSFYILPETGIPYVDLDPDVHELLDLAGTAYQKPTLGIPRTDLTEGTRASLTKADTAYQKPAGGIPRSDLADELITAGDLADINEHINDEGRHITDHTKLTNIGTYTHEQIDNKINFQATVIQDLVDEVVKARDEFSSIGARFDAALGKNGVYEVTTTEDLNKGTLDDLIVSQEGSIVFAYTPEPLILTVHNTADRTFLDDGNKVGSIFLSDKATFNNGNGDWINATGIRNNVGVRLVCYMYAPVTGTYDISVLFSGWLTLQVAGQTLVNVGGIYDTSDLITRGGSVDLEGGRLYPVVAECYYANSGDRAFGLYWKRPGMATQQEVPMMYLNRRGYDVNVGSYESHVIDLKDTEIATWYLEPDMVDYRTDDDITVEVSTSEDGVTFVDWLPTPAVGEIAAVPTRYVKLRMTIHKYYAQYTPVLRGYKIRFVSSGNNSYFQEIIDAREQYISLKERFDGIDEYLDRLLEVKEQFNATMIHPEYFYSIRMAGIEQNILKHYYEEHRTDATYYLLTDGFIDHFNTLDFIDQTRSNPFELTADKSIKQLQSVLTFDTDSDWNNFVRSNIQSGGGLLKLSFKNGGSAATVLLDNWYLWSYTNGALIGYSYQKYIAQPFYTKPETGSIKRIQLPSSPSSNGTTYEKLMLCGTLPNGEPDVNSPIWSSGEYPSYNGQNFDNLWIPVIGNQKYWIVCAMTNYVNVNYYAYKYVSYPNSNTSIRLRSDNPTGGALRYWYMDRSSNTWVKDNGSYYLTMQVEEATGYEPLGSASYIYDYGRPTRFLQSQLTLAPYSGGLLTVKFSSSDNQVDWSPQEEDITRLPMRRFLKIDISMTRGTLTGTGGSPLIDKLTVSYVGKDTTIITKAFDLSKVPNHALLLTEDTSKTQISYFVSRDNGLTWVPANRDTYTSLEEARPGTKIRLKAVMHEPDLNCMIKGWGLQGIFYRDITSQNITTLFEEYTATEGQVIFPLVDIYPMGNNAIQVYVNGIYQSIFKDYNEIDNRTIQFLEGLEAGDTVTFRVAAGAWDEHDRTLVSRMDLMEDVVYSDEWGSIPELAQRVDTLETVAGVQANYTIEYVYDNGKLEQEVYKDLQTDVILRTVDYTYDDAGRKLTETTARDGSVTTEEFTYNVDGTLKSKKITTSEVLKQ